MGSALNFDRFRRANVARCERAFHPVKFWTPERWALAMAGEVGEACNIIKKMIRENATLDDPYFADGEQVTYRVAIAKELADNVTYTDLLAAAIDIDLGQAVIDKFNVISGRKGVPIYLTSADCREARTYAAPAVLADIIAERGRQVEQWGGAAHDDAHRTYEWAYHINHQNAKLESEKHDTLAARSRLVKVAALAIAAIESIDRKAEAAPPAIAPKAVEWNGPLVVLKNGSPFREGDQVQYLGRTRFGSTYQHVVAWATEVEGKQAGCYFNDAGECDPAHSAGYVFKIEIANANAEADKLAA
ncbi:MAG: MazG-like family protein [Tepidisphaeraceae bacterium]